MKDGVKLTLHGAWKDVLAGDTDVALAIAVEKTFIPGEPARVQEIFEGGIDQFDRQEWMEYYRAAGEIAGKPFAPGATGGTLFMDTYAMQAAYHMKRFGTTQLQIAIGASKCHHYGSLNPLAQYQFEVSVEHVLADRLITFPLTRSMCAPVGDGAAAALVCSEKFMRSLSPQQQERAVKIRACHLAGGKYRSLDGPA
jgi:acetyl-CoA acetyltransferase